MTNFEFDLTKAYRSGAVKAGDVLVADPGGGLLQPLLARTQERALRDLYPERGDAELTSASRHSRAAMILGDGRCVTASPPRVRLISWREFAGDPVSVKVVRPLLADACDLLEAAAQAQEDALKGVPCRWRGFLRYWLLGWNWRKLHREEKFLQAFGPRAKESGGVGAAIDWWTRAGIPLAASAEDASPSAWYPARLLVDRRFPVVHSYENPFYKAAP